MFPMTTGRATVAQRPTHPEARELRNEVRNSFPVQLRVPFEFYDVDPALSTLCARHLRLGHTQPLGDSRLRETRRKSSADGTMSTADPKAQAQLMFACDASAQAIVIAVIVPRAFAPLIRSSPGMPDGVALTGVQFRVDSAALAVGNWLASERDPNTASLS